jgi:hypothetical protein
MALYRQIAGTGVPDRVGSYLSDKIADWVAPIFADNSTDYVPNTLQVNDTGGVAPYTDPREWNPIDQYKPPLTTTTFPTLTPSQPVTPDQQTEPGTTSTPLPTDIKTAVSNNLLPLVAIAGIVLVAIKGDDLLKEKRKIAFVGGLGLLYYGMKQKKSV